jgi:hypothetical protein
VVGCLVSLVILLHAASAPPEVIHVLAMLWLPLGWVVLYGCALHAAGFFLHRGIKLFGWVFILGGGGLFAMGIPDWAPRAYYANGIMGFFFGALHLAYGVYLYFTEQKTNAT